jgi:hypothetical protein
MSVVVGEQIQAGTGDWTGNPTAYTYQWQWSADGVTSDGDLAGETRSDHIVDGSDVGLYLRVAVTATNAGGSALSYSAWVGPVYADVGATFPTVAFAAGNPGALRGVRPGRPAATVLSGNGPAATGFDRKAPAYA